MFDRVTASVSGLLVIALIVAAFSWSTVDPVPRPDIPQVFCFRITDIIADKSDPEGDRFIIEFEVLNWTDTPATGMMINTNVGVSSGPGSPVFDSAAVDANGRPISSGDDNGDPSDELSPVTNDWTVTTSTSSIIEWGSGTAIDNIDLLGPPRIAPCTSPIDFIDFTDCSDETTAVPNTIDDSFQPGFTDNVLDGFVIAVDDWDTGEMLSFNWFLKNGTNLIGVAGSGNQFGFGAVNLSRINGGSGGTKLFAGNTGTSQSPTLFYDAVFSVPDPAEIAAEFGGGITASSTNNPSGAPANTCLIEGGDNTKPTSTLSISGSTAEVTFQDTQNGLGYIKVVKDNNANISIPVIPPNTTEPVTVTATKKDPSKPATVELKAFDCGGNTLLTDPVMTQLAGEDPGATRLLQNYPNPVNPTTTIPFKLTEKRHVTLTVYDALGREVATLVDRKAQPGHYEVQWDASGLASGVYVYRLKAGTFTKSREMTLVK